MTMRIQWVHSGRARTSRSRRYTHHVPDMPVGTWATDQLSLAYDRLHRAMTGQVPKAQSRVRSRSTVKTGLMRSMVDSFLSDEGERLVLEFGWWGGLAEGGPGPYYAPFQEFGGVPAPPAIHAVYETFHLTLPELERAVSG